jgi:O-antigen ligase
VLIKKEAPLIAILFLVPIIIQNEHYLRLTLKTFVYGCLVVFLVACLGDAHLLPAWSMFQHPAPYYGFFKIYGAFFMAVGTFFALNLLVMSQRYGKVFWGLCFLLISYNVLWQSYSRTGYILFFVLLLVFFVVHMRLAIIIAGSILAILTLLFAFHYSANFRDGFTQVYRNYQHAQQGEMRTSEGIRLQYWKDSLTLWKQKPLFGQGTGGYRAADITIKGITAAGGTTSYAAAQVTPENTFYRILVEQGLLGILLLIGLFAVQLYYAIFKMRGLRQKITIGFMCTIIFASFSQDLILDESPRLFYTLFTSLLYAPILLPWQKDSEK